MDSIRIGRRVVIYTRYSSDRQERVSCAQQERKVREGLAQAGIDATDAIVLSDEAISGKRDDRPAYRRLQEMVRAGHVSVLAVDQQCRISRGSKVVAFIEDCIYHRTRVLIVGDHIDTEDPNWEISSSVRQITNSMSNRDLAWRVRRAQERRLVEDDCISLGDHPFGYTTEYVDPDWMQQLQSGRKPLKRVIIHPEEAETVRLIFQLYVERRMSLSAIGRELNRLGCRKSHRAKGKPWGPDYVGRILDCEKYTGRWTWGVVEAVRDSAGRKRRQRAPKEKHVTANRPSLRIIDDATWDAARPLRTVSKQTWGRTFQWNRNRNPKRALHPRDANPSHNLAGLLRCGVCGSRLHYSYNRGWFPHFKCPYHTFGGCAMGRLVNVAHLDTVFYSFLAQICTQQSDWLDRVEQRVHEVLTLHTKQAPAHRARLEAQLADYTQQIKNLLAAITHSRGESQALVTTLQGAEKRKLEVERQLLELVDDVPALTPPDRQCVESYLRDLPQFLAVPSASAASCIRAMFPDAILEEITPGRKFSALRLRLKLNPYEVIGNAMGADWRKHAGLLLPETTFRPNDDLPWVELQVVRPTKWRKFGASIEAMRQQGMSWIKIAEKLEMTEGAAWSIHADWKRHQVAAAA